MRRARPRWLRAGRRGTSGRSCPCSARRPGGRRARRAACPRATEPGDSTSTTRSTLPMSMPSSRLLVATIAFSRPRLEVGLDHEPLLARERAVVRAHELFAREVVEAARRAARRADARCRTSSVVWCSRISSSSRGCTCGQMLARGSTLEIDRPVGRRPASYWGAGFCASSAMSSTGTMTSSSSSLREPGVDDRDRARSVVGPWPPRNRAISSSGRCVAERPMRCGGAVARSRRAVRGTA